MSVKRTERGWAGHFICADRCRYRRNTLIEGLTDKVVVSTVGAFFTENGLETIGAGGRYYETMAFGAMKEGMYIEADVRDERSFSSEWAICTDIPSYLPDDVDNHADAMHEAVVAEFMNRMSGEEG